MSATATIRTEEADFTGNQAGGGYAEFAALMNPETLDRLRKLVTRYAHNCIEADDLLQDAIERALRNWDTFKPGTNLMAWMRTIIQRRAIDQWRRQGGRTTVSSDDLIDPSGDEDPQPSWSQYSVEDVRRAMASLSEPLRITYQMHWIDGMSYDAIAARLGIAQATVGTRLIRARAKLRQLLEQGIPAKVIAIRENGRALPVRSSAKAPARWYPPQRPPLKHQPAPRRNGGDLSATFWPAAIAGPC
jgi:RNA polymerase sigma-70 factor, ECF subfamily